MINDIKQLQKDIRYLFVNHLSIDKEYSVLEIFDKEEHYSIKLIGTNGEILWMNQHQFSNEIRKVYVIGNIRKRERI